MKMMIQIGFTGSNKLWDRNRGSSLPSISSIISVKGSGLNPPPLVHQSASEIIQSGDSVTLNCTVHTGSCDGEHSVYWFKNSEDSPGLIHTHGGRNDQCERKPNTQTHLCVQPAMESLNPSHAGTYYCAVASCGHILFGNGTKLDFEDEVDSLVYFLSGALAINSILVVLLAFLVYKIKKRNICQSTGNSVTLNCTVHTGSCDGEQSVYWFKNSEDSPGLLYIREGRNDQCERKPNTHTHTCVYNLPMENLNPSHSGTYYCVVASCGQILFGNGTKLDFEDEVDSLVYFLTGALAFNSILVVLLAFLMSKMKREKNCQSTGGFVTLNCTVLTGSCDGEHSVYWFKNSEDSPGLIYTHGGRNDQCERKPNTQTQTCEYNLPMESLNPSHAGTYYCAVASCGHILFGNGTKLDFEGGVDSGFLVHFSSIALTFTAILSVLLAFLVCMMNKKNSCQSTVSSTAEAEDHNNGLLIYIVLQEYQRGEKIYYAALGVNLKNRSRRQRDQTWSECTNTS
ncbi:hypothetical protein F7725_004336 [Dissostichus mawsoni]|uniref:Ig-like domain-containing protein n=1 Tax=Dissostichus mawsoni TaxID=36200 RepID=A0A7J5XIE1_DISMA|nr:hypothetical protein F7725_004336 [Dissostichus mawsoni]